MELWPKKNRDIDLFDFTSFLAGTFFNFLAYCVVQTTFVEKTHVLHGFDKKIRFAYFFTPACETPQRLHGEYRHRQGVNSKHPLQNDPNIKFLVTMNWSQNSSK